MYSKPLQVLVALVVLGTGTARANPLLGKLHSFIAPLITGVINGRHSTEVDLDVKKSVVYLEAPGNAGSSKGCTATIIAGCLLTAGHCVTGAIGSIVAYAGTDVNVPGKAKALSNMADKRVIGESVEAGDIAILKPTRPFPKELSQPLSVLRKAAYTGTAGTSTLGVFGWGISETREDIDPKTGAPTRENFGSGVLRYGDLTYAGHPNPKEITYDRSQTPQITASGDSGAPIFERFADGSVELVAVHSAGTARGVRGEDKSALKAADNVKGHASAIASHYGAITKAFEEMSCKADDAPAVSPLETFVRREFAPYEQAAKAWDEAAKWQRGKTLEDFRQLVVDELRSRGQLSTAWSTIGLDGIQVRGNALEVRWSGMMDRDRERNNELTIAYLTRVGGTPPSGTLSISLEARPEDGR